MLCSRCIPAVRVKPCVTRRKRGLQPEVFECMAAGPLVLSTDSKANMHQPLDTSSAYFKIFIIYIVEAPNGHGVATPAVANQYVE